MALPAFVAAAIGELIAKFATASLIIVYYDDLVKYAVPKAKDALGYSAWHDEVNLAFGDFGEMFYYLMNVFQIDYGLELIFTTLLARFLIKRMPFIN